jgi:hypothetical protein
MLASSADEHRAKRGYPLLFQTGETADGRTHLVDRQHPHDFLMELATSYSVPLGRDGSAFAYVGLPASRRSVRRIFGRRDPAASPCAREFACSARLASAMRVTVRRGVSARGLRQAGLGRFVAAQLGVKLDLRRA